MAMANTRADHLPIPGGLLQGNLTVQRQRDLFPLPAPAFPLRCETTRAKSRSVCQRAGRRLAEGKEFAATVRGLNWLYGGRSSAGKSPPTAAQSEVLEYIEDCIHKVEAAPGQSSPQAALRELLGSKAAYGGESCKVAAFQEGSVSLPPVAGGVDLLAALPEEDRVMLEGFEHSLCVLPAELERRQNERGLKPY